jgi:hypothetical protein
MTGSGPPGAGPLALAFASPRPPLTHTAAGGR